MEQNRNQYYKKMEEAFGYDMEELRQSELPYNKEFDELMSYIAGNMQNEELRERFAEIN